jgi:hypothetical protein
MLRSTANPSCVTRGIPTIDLANGCGFVVVLVEARWLRKVVWPAIDARIRPRNHPVVAVRVEEQRTGASIPHA